MKRDYRLFVEDILDSLEKIEEFVADMSFEEFVNDDKTSSAVISKFEIMGEASKFIPEIIRNKYAEIPWKEMAGMREKLIHAYSEVDFKLVWMTIKQRIPEIKPLLRKLLDELSE